MPEPIERNQMSRYQCPVDCVWRDAFLVLRNVVLNPRNAPAPVKCLGGAVTVVESVLARQLGIPLGALLAEINGALESHDNYKSAEDRAESTYPNL